MHSKQVTALAAVLAVTGLALAPVASAKKAASRHHAPKAAAKPADSAAWLPEPKLLTQLEPERTFGDYLVRFPKDFQAKEQTLDEKYGTALVCEASGIKRPDGSVPMLLLVNGHAGQNAVALSVDTLMERTKSLRDAPGAIETETQDGRTATLDVSRRYFKYPDSKHPGHFIHGLVYATTDSHSNCVMIAVDAEPYSATTLPLLETAVRTLRKP